jgi:hypothetical protein
MVHMMIHKQIILSGVQPGCRTPRFSSQNLCTANAERRVIQWDIQGEIDIVR